MKDRFKLDKSKIEITMVGSEPDDVAYWRSKSATEQFEAMEFL